jgi:hypothetical protein
VQIHHFNPQFDSELVHIFLKRNLKLGNMTSRDFVYWLQGFMEIADPKALTEEQIKTVRNHINMVFIHEIDPSYGDAKHQQKLQDAHDAKKEVSGGLPSSSWPDSDNTSGSSDEVLLRC